MTFYIESNNNQYFFIWDLIGLIAVKLFQDGGRYHTQTSPLISSASQWTGFYMITASVMKEFRWGSCWSNTLLISVKMCTLAFKAVIQYRNSIFFYKKSWKLGFAHITICEIAISRKKKQEKSGLRQISCMHALDNVKTIDLFYPFPRIALYCILS